MRVRSTKRCLLRFAPVCLSVVVGGLALAGCQPPGDTEVAALRALALRIDVRADLQKTSITSLALGHDLLRKLDQAEASVQQGAPLGSAFGPFETTVTNERGRAIYAQAADKLLSLSRGQTLPPVTKVSVGATSTVNSTVNGFGVSVGIPSGTTIAAVSISGPVVPHSVTPVGPRLGVGGVRIRAWGGQGRAVTQPSHPLALSLTFAAPSGVHPEKAKLNTVDPVTLLTQPLTTTVTQNGASITASATATHLSPFEITAPVDSGIVTNYAGSPGEGLATSVGQYESGLLSAQGALYISDFDADVIRVMDTSTGRETVFAGTTGGNPVAMAPDGGSATAGPIHRPMGLAKDGAANIYVAASGDNRVRKIDALGVVTTVAGRGDLNHPGYAGDGGPATDAYLNGPMSVAFDPLGNLYIADSGNHVVRKVDTNGIISTLPWNRGMPTSVAVDGSGTLYIASVESVGVVYSQLVTKVDSSGTVGVLDSRPGSGEQFLALDGQGNLLITDYFASVVRSYNLSTGASSTFAGTGATGFGGDGGPANGATFNGLFGITVDDGGTTYLADSVNQRVRSVDYAGTVTTVAGNGTARSGGDGGPATWAQLAYPFDVAVDAGGNLLVTDYSNGAVRKVDPSGTISTLATGIIGASGVAVGPDGSVYVSSRRQAGRSSVVKVDSSGGTTPIAAGLANPEGLAVDVAGNVYVADTNQARVFRIDPAGTMTPFAGNGQTAFRGDGGPATAASLSQPHGLAIDGVGNLYISDYGHERVRRVDSAGTISTVAGNGTTGFGGDGGPATAASLNSPLFVAVDASGRLYIADSENSRVRRVDGNGVITTVVGAGTYGHSGDGGAAIDAQFAFIDGIAFDASDNLFLADSGNGCVRRVEH